MKQRVLLFAAALFVLAGCSSVTRIGKQEMSDSSGRCRIDVYQTHDQATANGPIEELCIITGTSSGSFSHTVDTAIRKRLDDACACGATAVYIRSQSQTWWEVATVDMVAFRYVNAPQK